ncbi:hypothetical protein EG329_013133 [Mollisiaceae sp. DMI_Dod_QoI]|nr:hypothetical protein EG329_013133 [Helotiales sp. DMI_Dod_QoI]
MHNRQLGSPEQTISRENSQARHARELDELKRKVIKHHEARSVFQQLRQLIRRANRFFLAPLKVAILLLVLLFPFRLASQPAFVTKFILNCLLKSGMNEELAASLTKVILRSHGILSLVLPIAFILVLLDELADNQKSSSGPVPSDSTSQNNKTDEHNPPSTTNSDFDSGPFLV